MGLKRKNKFGTFVTHLRNGGQRKKLPNNGIYSDYITVNGVTTPNAMKAGTMIH